MKCEICNDTEIEGDLSVFDAEAQDGALVISILETVPRNHIICDSCNKAVCKNCCSNPRSGYCDICIERYSLLDNLKEIEANYP
jgi:hypothetical protein